MEPAAGVQQRLGSSLRRTVMSAFAEMALGPDRVIGWVVVGIAAGLLADLSKEKHASRREVVPQPGPTAGPHNTNSHEGTMDKSTEVFIAMVGLAVLGLAAFAVYRWRQRERVRRVERWVKDYLVMRYGE